MDILPLLPPPSPSSPFCASSLSIYYYPPSAASYFLLFLPNSFTHQLQDLLNLLWDLGQIPSTSEDHYPLGKSSGLSTVTLQQQGTG